MLPSSPGTFAAALSLLLLCTACGSAQSTVEAAIAAANEDEPAAFLDTLDVPSRAFFEKAQADTKILPSEWRLMAGKAHLLLKGAEVLSTEEITDHVTLVRLKGASSGLAQLYAIDVGENILPDWRLHLVDARPLFETLLLVRQ